MSTYTDDHLRALAYIAVELRPAGAPRWEREGVYAVAAKLRDKGYGFPEIVNRITKHAQDFNAQTPGVAVVAPLRDPPAEVRAHRQPKKGDPNECVTHPGQWAATCSPCRAETIAGERTTRADEPATKADPEAIAEIRRAAGLPQFRDPKRRSRT